MNRVDRIWRENKLGLLVGVVVLVMVGCTPDPPEKPKKTIDKTLLYGYWKVQGGTERWNYKNDGTAYHWDESDDVYEDEAQKMKWEIEDNTLTLFMVMEVDGSTQLAGRYTILHLKAESFSYQDSFKQTTTLIKDIE